MRFKFWCSVSFILSVSLMLSGCAMNKQGGGTLIGGVTGGLIGSQFGKGNGALFATGLGALAGAMIGGQIGKGMDDQDRKILELTSQKALEYSPSGSTTEWKNPDTGNHGYVTPVRTFKGSDGAYCREYNHTIIIGGKQEKAYGKACRKPDGSWQIVQ